MSIEIERKYLVKNKLWKKDIAEKKHITQGYIKSADATVRIRCYLDNHTSVITVKGKRKGISRLEYEYEIPYEEGLEIQKKLCRGGLIKKTRNIIYFKNLKWEVDEFYGKNEGLVVAEVEISSEKQDIKLPKWVGKEVSYEIRYRNSRLITRPFCKWSDKKNLLIKG